MLLNVLVYLLQQAMNSEIACQLAVGQQWQAWAAVLVLNEC